MKKRLINLIGIILSLTLLGSCSYQKNNSSDKQVDICIYGGTSAGVIAAYSAKKMGKSVLIIEPGDRLGGLTSGGLGQTDIGNKHAVTGLARDFYRRLGKYYNTFEQWKFEPKAALEIFQQYINEKNIDVLYMHRIVNAEVNDGKIEKIILENSANPSSGSQKEIDAKMFIDCTYEGDLMAKAGVTYTVGREDNNLYNETVNGVQLKEEHQFPDNIDPYIERGNPESGLLWGIQKDELVTNGTGDRKVQAYNFRICLTDSTENLVPIDRPENYDSTKYELLLRLIEAQSNKNLFNYFIWSGMPNRKTDINNRGGFSTDMIGMNWDYPEASYEKRQRIIDEHIDYTKGLLYFWGHDPKVPQQAREEMLKWGYPKDEYINNNHFSPQLYVREARRMVGEYVMTEHHCRGDEVVSDPIALAAYTMDSHNCQRIVTNGMVKNEGDVQVGGFPPYPVSYRSLLPKSNECKNLFVPVCLSASHIAFGSIRMEPVFMVLGQVSAVAASIAIDENQPIQDIDAKKIQDILETNPLLDGTPPDVIVDDADLDLVTVSGSWETQHHFMRNYKSSLLYKKTGDAGSITFQLPVKIKGKYKVFFYCSHPWNPDLVLPEVINLSIAQANTEEQKEINYKKNLNNWAYVGSYIFNPEEKNSIKLISGTTQACIADAVILVPEK